MMMTYRSSQELPRSLRGQTLWLQLLYLGNWSEACELRASDARALCRWLDQHPQCRHVRVSAVSTG